MHSIHFEAARKTVQKVLRINQALGYTIFSLLKLQFKTAVNIFILISAAGAISADTAPMMAVSVGTDTLVVTVRVITILPRLTYVRS